MGHRKSTWERKLRQERHIIRTELDNNEQSIFQFDTFTEWYNKFIKPSNESLSLTYKIVTPVDSIFFDFISSKSFGWRMVMPPSENNSSSFFPISYLIPFYELVLVKSPFVHPKITREYSKKVTDTCMYGDHTRIVKWIKNGYIIEIECHTGGESLTWKIIISFESDYIFYICGWFQIDDISNFLYRVYRNICQDCDNNKNFEINRAINDKEISFYG